MNLKETIDAARDSITVGRVYGEPYERNGVAVIPRQRFGVAEAEAAMNRPTARMAAAASVSWRARLAPT